MPPSEHELRLRERLGRLRNLPLLGGARLSGELERRGEPGQRADVRGFERGARESGPEDVRPGVDRPQQALGLGD